MKDGREYTIQEIRRSEAYIASAFASFKRQYQQLTGEKSVVGTYIYEKEVDFCYLQHEIQVGPQYFAAKLISDANDLIEKLEQEISRIRAQKAQK